MNGDSIPLLQLFWTISSLVTLLQQIMSCSRILSNCSVFLATHLCMLSVVYSVPHSPHVFDLKISTYEQQSKRNDDEGTTVSCCAPYLICLCISNFYCVAHPCLTNVIYIQTTVSVYTIYERQANLIKNRERRENCDTVRCVCYVYSIVYCTTSSTSHISDIFNYLCCRSGG